MAGSNKPRLKRSRSSKVSNGLDWLTPGRTSGIAQNETPLQRPEEPGVCGLGTTAVTRGASGLRFGRPCSGQWNQGFAFWRHWVLFQGQWPGASIPGNVPCGGGEGGRGAATAVPSPGHQMNYIFLLDTLFRTFPLSLQCKVLL